MLKLSFPMPMWRQPTDDTTPVSQLESPSENGTPPAPTVYLSSKAEKLLGGPESRGLNKKFAVRKTTKTQHQQHQQPALRKSPSYMDMVIADAAIGDTPSPIDTADTVSSPDSHIAASQSLQPPPIPRLHRHGSSPLLGELARQSKLPGSPTVDYFSGRHGSAPDTSAPPPPPPASNPKKKSQLTGTVHHRPIERVATVMDAFDAPPGQRRPSQTPSERSQPRTPLTPITPGSPAYSDKSSRKPSSASDVSYKSRASSKARLSTMPRFRQASQSSQEAPTSNPEPQTSEPVSEITNKQHHYNSHRWFHRSKGSNPGYVPPIPAHQVTNPRFSSVKVNVRRPRPGTHHWFDAVEEDEISAESPEEEPSESVNAAPGYYHYLLTAKEEPSEEMADAEEEPLSPPPPPPTQPLPHIPKQRPASAVRHSNLPQNRQQRSNVRRSHQPQPTAELSGPRQMLADHLQRLSVARSVSPKVRVPLATSPPVAPVAENPHAEEINLHMESVLSLSSSDDEKDGGKAAATVSTAAARADVGDEVLTGGNVPRVPARRARPRANTQQSLTPPPPPAQQRPTWDPATTALPPTPPAPSHSAPPATAPRNSSLRWRHTMNNATTFTKPGRFPTANALRTEPATIMEDVSSSFRPQTTAKSSLVTSDDEKLLGAMREKRASLRQQAASTAAGNQALERRGSLPGTPGTQQQQQQQQQQHQQSSPVSQRTSPPLMPPMLTPAVYTGPLAKRGGANSSSSNNYNGHKRVGSSVSGSAAHPKKSALNVATSHRVSLRLRRMSRSMDDLSLCNQREEEEEEEQLRADEDAFGPDTDINAMFPAPPSNNNNSTSTIPISFSADVGTTHSATSSGTNSTIRPFSLQPQAYSSKTSLSKQSRQESTSSATSANRPPSLVSSSGRPSVSSPASASDNSTSPSTPSTGNNLPLTPPMPPLLAMGIKPGSSGSYSSQGSGSFSSVTTPEGLVVSNSDASLSSRHFVPSHHRQQKSFHSGAVALPPCPYPPPNAPVPLPPTRSSASPSPSTTRASSASPMQQLPYARPPMPPPQPSKSPAPSIASTSTTRSFRSASSSPAPPGKLTATGSSGSIHRTRGNAVADVPRRDSATSAAAAAAAAIAATSSSNNSTSTTSSPSPLNKKGRGSVLARAHPAFLQQEHHASAAAASSSAPPSSASIAPPAPRSATASPTASPAGSAPAPAAPVTRPLPPHRRTLSTTKINTNVPPAGKNGGGSPSSPIKRGRELAYAQFHASRRASNGSSPAAAATAVANTAPLNVKKTCPSPVVTTGPNVKVGGQVGMGGPKSPPPPEVPQRSIGHRYHSSLDEQERIAERERKVEEEDIIGWALKTY